MKVQNLLNGINRISFPLKINFLLKKVIFIFSFLYIFLATMFVNIWAENLIFNTTADPFYITDANKSLCVTVDENIINDQRCDSAKIESIGFLDNDVIEEGNNVFVSIVKQPRFSTGGPLESFGEQFLNTGYFKYQPTTVVVGNVQYPFFGTDTFDYILKDCADADYTNCTNYSATTTVTINVVAENRAPISLRTEPFKINEDTPKDLNFYQFSFASTTSDDISFNITFITNLSDGDIQYSNAFNEFKLAAIAEKEAEENGGDLDAARILKETKADVLRDLERSFLAYDLDPNSTLTFVKDSEPTNGQLSFATSTNIFTFIPNRNYAGTDTFQFKISDGTLESPLQNLDLDIVNVNDAPTVSLIGSSTIYVANGEVINQPSIDDFTANDVDNLDTLTKSFEIFVNGNTVNTVDTNIEGNYLIVYQALDNGTVPGPLLATTSKVIVVLPPEVLAPIFSNDIDNDGINNSEDVDIDGDGIINFYDTDVDGDMLNNDIDPDNDMDNIDDINDESVN